MPILKHLFLIFFFVKILPVVLYPYTFDDFLYSNEEIAIGILFILFVGTVEKFFGQTIYDALMEKAKYLRELHGTFTKEKYVFLKKQKENLVGMKKISQIFPMEETKFGAGPIFFSFKKKLASNEIHKFYEEQLQQLLQVSNEDYKPMISTFTKVFHEEYSNEKLLD